MPADVICLRPEADFTRVDAPAPGTFSVSYHKPDDPALPQLFKVARALVMPAVGPKLPTSLFEGSSLKLIQVTGAGLDRLDRPGIAALGIPVANVPGGSNSAVAEYAVTTASTLLRRFGWSDNEIRRGNYESFRARMLADNLAGLDGLTAGVIGLGVIGLAVAQAFHRAGCKIAYYDPAPRDAAAAEAIGAVALSLDELLATSDIITLHVPLIEATAGLIGARELSRMKKTAVLVQAARGGIVDEAALVEALGAGTIAGAAVDVYSKEPPPADNPLLTVQGEARDRLLLTPHIAGVMRQSSATLFRASWENVQRVLRGEAPLHRAY